MENQKEIDIQKADYITTQLERTRNKKFENYCISRIYHLLNNLDIQFVTQQMLKRKDNRIALADLYLPQLDIWVEIDESHHNNQHEEDENRTKEVLVINNKLEKLEEVLSVKNKPLRIRIQDNGLDDINRRIDEIIQIIEKRINELEKSQSLQKWEVTYKQPEYYINKGYIDSKDRPAFKTIQEVSELFNKGYKGTQKCWFRDLPESKTTIWCPKLKFDSTDKGKYDNYISSDGKIIYESNPQVKENVFIKGVIKMYNEGFIKRYVFLKFKDSSGRNMYRFKGVFKLDLEKSKKEKKAVYVKSNSIIKLDKYFN